MSATSLDEVGDAFRRLFDTLSAEYMSARAAAAAAPERSSLQYEADYLSGRRAGVLDALQVMSAIERRDYATVDHLVERTNATG